MVIQRSDRVAEVLKRDEGLIGVFVAASPVFQGLRNPLMRRTMGWLATVEQAARVAGINPEALVERLNHASDADPEITSAAGASPITESQSREEESMSAIDTGVPPALARIPADRVVDLDVREELRNGQEPFSRIMAAKREVPPGGVLRLRAIFEPAPLYAVMAKQGFDHWTEELAEDDWRVWFFAPTSLSDTAVYPAESAQERETRHHPVTPSPRHSVTDVEAEGGEKEVIVLDVRGMEPPEPMARTYEIREQHDALIRVFIRRRT